MIRWMKYRYLYFVLSTILIIVGIVSIALWGFRLGIDFKGGTLLEYKFNKPISTEEIIKKMNDAGLRISTVQQTSDNSYLLRFPEITQDDRQSVYQLLVETAGETAIEELRYETVGPSIGPELVRKTIYAIVIASVSILLWVAYQFKSLKYGLSAVLAMFHDTFILIGIYALLGHLFGAEIDFLFVTALLTTLSFSVHDTIVVYDRIRETHRKEGGNVTELADRAVTETMVRSLNNSFTIIFMLLALVLLGGTTIRWFAIALFIGTILGTYSSPFVAVPLLVTWEKWENRTKK